jgi:hypothetical protein
VGVKIGVDEDGHSAWTGKFTFQPAGKPAFQLGRTRHSSFPGPKIRPGPKMQGTRGTRLLFNADKSYSQHLSFWPDRG